MPYQVKKNFAGSFGAKSEDIWLKKGAISLKTS